MGDGEYVFDTDTSAVPSENDAQSSSSQVLTDFNLRLTAPLGASGAQIIPNIASEVRLQLTHTRTGSITTDIFLWNDDVPSNVIFSEVTTASPPYTNRTLTRVWCRPDGEWRHTEGTGGTSTISVLVNGWRDSILARR
jgi:hypothetical protein